MTADYEDGRDRHIDRLHEFGWHQVLISWDPCAGWKIDVRMAVIGTAPIVTPPPPVDQYETMSSDGATRITASNSGDSLEAAAEPLGWLGQHLSYETAGQE